MNVIYRIENTQTKTIYIGKSSDFNRRKCEHITKLNANKHYNKHLQRSFNKYKRNKFKFLVIECILDDDFDYINSREIYWIDFYNSFKKGFNQSYGGEGGPHNKGKIWSQEVKDKISQANKAYYKLNKPTCINTVKYVYQKNSNLFVGMRYELKQKLNNVGIKVSSSNLSRIEKDHNKHCRGWKILACNLNKGK